MAGGSYFCANIKLTHSVYNWAIYSKKWKLEQNYPATFAYGLLPGDLSCLIGKYGSCLEHKTLIGFLKDPVFQFQFMICKLYSNVLVYKDIGSSQPTLSATKRCFPDIMAYLIINYIIFPLMLMGGGGSRVRRPGSEDPYRRNKKKYCHKRVDHNTSGSIDL